MYNFGDCSESISHPKISLKEKHKVCFILNTNRLQLIKVKIDDCLDLEGPRCDYLVIKPSENHGRYIELKGRDVPHAIKQLENSIKEIEKNNSPYINQKFNKRECYIITNSNPMSTTQLQNKQKNFKIIYQASLIIKKSGWKIDF